MTSNVLGFDPGVPLDEASTPPSAWYVDPDFHALERRRVFGRNWQFAARVDQLAEPGSFVAGNTAGEPWVVLRHPDRKLRAFANVCRHHAAEICTGTGRVSELACPYHRWTYDLDGRLLSAPELGGAKDFNREEFCLPELAVEVFEPFVFVHPGRDPRPLAPDLGELRRRLDDMGTGKLRFVKRMSYTMQCNWKVFVDNYLDGGYHIAHLHLGLAAELDMPSYRTELFERMSIQSSGGSQAEGERVDWGAVYAFIHPNFMVNRYGPWMDTNLLLPLGHERCEVVMDYYLDRSYGVDGAAFVEESLAASRQIHMEDVTISESVQRGVASSTYERGRYSVARERAMHQFHGLLAADLGRD